MAIVRGAVLPRGVGIYGVVFGAFVLLTIFSGKMKSEHAITVVVLGQCIWFFILGVLLWRLRESAISQV